MAHRSTSRASRTAEYVTCTSVTKRSFPKELTSAGRERTEATPRAGSYLIHWVSSKRGTPAMTSAAEAPKSFSTGLGTVMRLENRTTREPVMGSQGGTTASSHSPVSAWKRRKKKPSSPYTTRRKVCAREGGGVRTVERVGSAVWGGRTAWRRRHFVEDEIRTVKMEVEARGARGFEGETAADDDGQGGAYLQRHIKHGFHLVLPHGDGRSTASVGFEPRCVDPQSAIIGRLSDGATRAARRTDAAHARPNLVPRMV